MNTMNIWILLGALFLIFEILNTSFYAFFFGIGALITGFLVWGGIVNNGALEITVFGICSLGSLGLFRDKLRILFLTTKENYVDMLGEKAKVLDTITESREGKVFFRGSDWIAVTHGNSTFEKDSLVKIVGTEGIKLVVE